MFHTSHKYLSLIPLLPILLWREPLLRLMDTFSSSCAALLTGQGARGLIQLLPPVPILNLIVNDCLRHLSGSTDPGSYGIWKKRKTFFLKMISKPHLCQSAIAQSCVTHTRVFLKRSHLLVFFFSFSPRPSHSLKFQRNIISEPFKVQWRGM